MLLPAILAAAAAPEHTFPDIAALSTQLVLIGALAVVGIATALVVRAANTRASGQAPAAPMSGKQMEAPATKADVAQAEARVNQRHRELRQDFDSTKNELHARVSKLRDETALAAERQSDRTLAAIATLSTKVEATSTETHNRITALGSSLAHLSGEVSATLSAHDSRHGYHEFREEDHPRDPQGRFAQAQTALATSLHRKANVYHAIHHPTLGRIDFLWGRPGNPRPNEHGRTHLDGYGISHIAAKHPDALKHIPAILAYGTVEKSSQGVADKIEIHYQGRRIALSKTAVPSHQLSSFQGKRGFLRGKKKHYYTITSYEG